MLHIDTQKEENTLRIGLKGRLDSLTADQLENELKADLGGVKELIMDLQELEYISSARLRVLLFALKTIQAQQGTMIVRNVNETVMDIFTVTGFTTIMTIE